MDKKNEDINGGQGNEHITLAEMDWAMSLVGLMVSDDV